MLQITKERKKAGLSQCKLAQLAGINPTSLSRIEQGKEPAFRKRGLKIAEAIGWKGETEDLFRSAENDES